MSIIPNRINVISEMPQCDAAIGSLNYFVNGLVLKNEELIRPDRSWMWNILMGCVYQCTYIPTYDFVPNRILVDTDKYAAEMRGYNIVESPFNASIIRLEHNIYYGANSPKRSLLRTMYLDDVFRSIAEISKSIDSVPPSNESNAKIHHSLEKRFSEMEVRYYGLSGRRIQSYRTHIEVDLGSYLLKPLGQLKLIRDWNWRLEVKVEPLLCEELPALCDMYPLHYRNKDGRSFVVAKYLNVDIF